MYDMEILMGYSAVRRKQNMLTYGKIQGRIKEEIDTKGVVVYELS